MTNTKNVIREARWRGIVRRQMAGRLGAAEFCRCEGLALSTFHWWRRRLQRPIPAAIEWIEAQTATVPFAETTCSGIAPAVRVGTDSGLYIEFASSPSAELLAAALLVLHSTHRSSC